MRQFPEKDKKEHTDMKSLFKMSTIYVLYKIQDKMKYWSHYSIKDCEKLFSWLDYPVIEISFQKCCYD